MNESAIHAVMTEARSCALVMLYSATHIQNELANVQMNDALRTQTEQVCTALIGTKHDIITELDERAAVKGECTLLVSGNLEEGLPDPEKIKTEIVRLLASGEAGTSEVSKQVARKFNISKKEVYASVLEVKEKQKNKVREF